MFLVLKTVNYVPHESVALAREIVETGEIMVFVGPEFVVTVRHGDHSGLAGVRRKMEDEHKQLALGPYAVMHRDCRPRGGQLPDVSRLMEFDIDAIEEDTFSPTAQTNVEQIYLLKREVVELRRAVSPLSVALGRLQSDSKDLLSRRSCATCATSSTTRPRRPTRSPAATRCCRLVQAAPGQGRDAAEHRHAQDLGVGGIAAVPTMVAGIYGMNFERMPELHPGVGISRGAAADGLRVRLPLPELPAQPLAVISSAGPRPAAGR